MKRKIKAEKNKKPPVLVIVGSTSSGKTAVAVKLARLFAGEIIGADSRQVYRGLDIGSGKDISEYGSGRNKVPYHLIDVADPRDNFDLANYQRLASKAIKEVISRGHLPIIAGGSGLYFQALVDGYLLSSPAGDKNEREELEALGPAEILKRLSILKPEFAERLNNSERHNARRLARYLEIFTLDNSYGERPVKKSPPYNFLVIGLSYPDEILKERIFKRLDERLKEGLVEEVENLNQSGLSWQRLDSFGLEYRYTSRYLQGLLDYEELREKLGTAIYRFAKRQKTWLKRWEKQGRKIYWAASEEDAVSLVSDWLNN